MQISSQDTRFKPDFGTKLLNAGYSDMLLEFALVPAHFVAFLDDGTMAVTGNLVSEGQTYKVTFDVPASLISDFFAGAPGWLKQFLRAIRPNADEIPIVVLPELYQVGVRARLGKRVQGQFETFVPLVVSSILPVPSHAQGEN
jgi:hypothetical protein